MGAGVISVVLSKSVAESDFSSDYESDGIETHTQLCTISVGALGIFEIGRNH